MERIAGCPNLRDMGGIKVKNGYDSLRSFVAA